MDKVIIPKEVAEAIETLRNDGLADLTIISEYIKSVSVYAAQMNRSHLDEFMTLRIIGGEKLMQALVIGWEIKKSKKDLVRGALAKYTGYEASAWIIDRIHEIYEGANGDA